MNNLRLLFCLLIINGSAFAQKNQEIKEWQEKNPNVLFIEKNDASTELIEKMNLLGLQYIVYENELTENDILTFTNNNSLKSDYYQIDGYNVRIEESQFVKEWLASHQDIKILLHSQISQLTPEQISQYQSISALFLEGDIITMNDLKNYDNEH